MIIQTPIEHPVLMMSLPEKAQYYKEAFDEIDDHEIKIPNQGEKEILLMPAEGVICKKINTSSETILFITITKALGSDTVRSLFL